MTILFQTAQFVFTPLTTALQENVPLHLLVQRSGLQYQTAGYEVFCQFDLHMESYETPLT